MIELNYELGFRAIKSLLTSKHHGERSVVADDAYTNDLNEQLMFDALKVVPLEDVHIDQLIALAKASRNTSSSLARVKIQLYEKKKDYPEAFMQHLNEESERKYIFSWISETFESLKKEAIEWKREQGILEEVKEENEDAESA